MKPAGGSRIRIIPLGPSGSGKTVLLSVIFSVLGKAAPLSGLTKSLQLNLSQLERGQWQPLSSQGYVEEVDMSGYFTRPGPPAPSRFKADFSIMDYSGSLLFSKEGGEGGILKKIEAGSRLEKPQEVRLLSSILGASAFILLLDPDLTPLPHTKEDDHRFAIQREYLVLIDLLIRNGLNTKPMMVLLTKADLIVGAGGYRDFAERSFGLIVRALDAWEPTRMMFGPFGLETTRTGGMRYPVTPLRPLGHEEIQAWFVSLLGGITD